MRAFRFRSATREAFTLVELLVAIAIIGVLAGLTTLGLASARRYALSTRIAMEATQLGSAVTAYQLKYGDYPPDFSDATVVERHFRKIFPKIQNSELMLLGNAMARYSPAGNIALGIDRAEALVFCLGGYSDDPKYPFTGPGGPLQAKVPPVIDLNGNGTIDGAELGYIDNYQYNTDRNIGFYEFKVGQLTLIPDMLPVLSSDDWADSTAAQAAGVTPIWSQTGPANNDLSGSSPTVYSAALKADPFPAYQPQGRQMPYVYFDSRTYGFVTSGAYYFNNYAPRPLTADYKGVARPYKSATMNTSAIGGTPPAATDLHRLDAVRAYENKDSFQVISAGYDDHFGGVYDLLPTGTPSSAAVCFIASTGQAFRCNLVPNNPWPPSGSVSGLGIDPAGNEFKYETITVDGLAQQDNVTSFTAGELANQIQQ